MEDDKASRFTLMEQILLLGLKDREVIFFIIFVKSFFSPCSPFMVWISVLLSNRGKQILREKYFELEVQMTRQHLPDFRKTDLFLQGIKSQHSL